MIINYLNQLIGTLPTSYNNQNYNAEMFRYIIAASIAVIGIALSFKVICVILRALTR